MPRKPSLAFCRRALRACLDAREPTLACTAARMGFSVRTLQRRLHDAGVRFSVLRDEARCDAACRMLEAHALPIHDIATRLGFADASSFSRSFQRWMGMTPREFRRRGPAQRPTPPHPRFPASRRGVRRLAQSRAGSRFKA